jgi:valyl-tRNA synthetase
LTLFRHLQKYAKFTLRTARKSACLRPGLPQTNSTRAKTLELHIQQRVAEELEKIKKHESAALEAIRKKIAEESSLDSSSVSPKDLIPGIQNDEEQKRKAQSSQKVQQEIEKLKQQLGQRKSLKELPKEVENACVTTLYGICDIELTMALGDKTLSLAYE